MKVVLGWIVLALAAFLVQAVIVTIWPLVVIGIMANEFYQHYALTRRQRCARRRMNSPRLSTTNSEWRAEEREYLQLLAYVSEQRKKALLRQS